MKNNQEKIIKEYEEISKIKIDVENMLSERIEKNEMFNLVTDQNKQNKILGNINIYIPEFMHQLWNSPKSIATILLKANKNDIKKYLAHFITHNLYDNISSLNHKDEQLLYIITLLLKEEIKSLKNINNSFFADKRCGMVLEELNQKKEVKSFFKIIILEIIKKLENTYSTEDILLFPEKIKKKIEEKSNIEKEKEENINETFNLDENIKINESINNDELETKKVNYLFQSFSEKELNKKLSEYKNKEMKDFLEKIIEEFKLSPLKYLNEALKSQIYKEEKDKSQEMINYYKNSVKQIIDIIDMLFDNLLNNSDILPYSIKCVCKIISTLMDKKFPDAIKVEKNKVLVNFFFHTLFFPILINPSLAILINEIIITDATIEKLQFIFLTILNNITLGQLFKENVFTPFNWYIVETMPKVIEFLDNICQVKLPTFIDKLINDELPEDYEYDFFKENPDEDILYRNICYNIDELHSLITNAVNLKDDISIDKRILTKFQKNSNNQKIQKLRRSVILEGIKLENIINNDEKRMINCFLLTDSINNEKIKKILDIQKYNKKYFTLKELKIIQTEEEKIKNEIIKVKNFFYALLYHYPTLSKYTFKEEKLFDMINILNELKNHSFNNTSIYMDSNYIPFNWYINSLIQYLPKLPQNLIENDYEELLNQLENEITSSIKELNLEELSIFIEYLKDIEKEKFYLENIKNIINDIDLNKKVQTLVQSELISLDSKGDDKSLYQFFSNLAKDKKIKEFSHLFSKEKRHKINNTIVSFVNNFPNISNFQLNYDIDIFKFMEEKKIPQIINKYMILIKNNLKEKNIENEKNLEDIYNKIYDYIMEKLYYKLYPKEPDIADNIIFQNCFKHYWVELENLIKEKKNYIFDNYLPDTINYFEQFAREKSPRKKLLCIGEIFNCLYNLGKFNEDNVEGADDEIPLLNYAFIKSKPTRIYSNCRYTELFMGKSKFGIEGSQLAKIFGICEQMRIISYKKLFNISESDYNKNCDLATKKSKN